MAFNACIIGISGFGDVHYKDLVTFSERGILAPLGATVINQDQEAEKCAKLRALGCKLYTDHRQMLADFKGRIDLCFIPTGIHLHRPMTIDALEAGANVYVEKPVAATVEDVAAMRAAAERTGKFVAVGYQTMYARETMLMKRLLCAGALGKVESVKYWGLWPRDDAYYARNNWAGRLKVGDAWVLDSPYNNALAHQLNMIAFLAGAEVEKSARPTGIQAELYRGHDITSADTAFMRVKTAEGPQLYCCVTHCSQAQSGPEITVRAARGKMVWNFKTLRIEYADGRVEETAADGGYIYRENIMRQLLARIWDGRAFVCDLDIAGTQTLIVNGAHDSSAIATVPAELITRAPEKDSVKTVIAGIDELILKSCADEKLPSEMGVAWARAGREVDLRNYPAFGGGRN